MKDTNHGDLERDLVEDLEDLYENAPCGYLSLRPDGRIFKANATLAGWVGLEAPSLVGKKLHDLLTLGSRIFYETHHAPLLVLQGHFDEVSFDLKTADGEKLPVFANAVEHLDPIGRHRFTRLTIFKAAERRRYERELVQARATAEAASAQSQALQNAAQNLLDAEREIAKFREEFIAVLGHDLRNPLTSISGGARLLLKDPQTERGKRLLDMMQGSVFRMSALIDNVLDFARGRLGDGIGLNVTPAVLLEPVFEQVVSELRIGVPDHDIVTQFALEDPVSCDVSRIGQLVSNLIGNALTHGASDVPVRVYGGVANGELTVWVANAGKPIPPGAMARLFHPFFRGDMRASQQGLGLGLHIASEIAKAHRGSLTVESSESETRFTFRMPQFASAEDR